LLTAIDSLAEREARRERAQTKKARARGTPAPTGLSWQERQELDRRCAEDDQLPGLARERSTARRLHALATLAEARVDLDRRPGDPPRREVLLHVDAAVLADDTAAGRAALAGGPALTAAQARRMLCEASVLTLLEHHRQPLALGRTRRRASRAQRRALLRRDGGCARPGCPETRIERLHAHHLRHWLFGGRTDLANLVLLCDADHGLAHDHNLVMTRTNSRLLVTTPDGRHVWGTADAAFTTGLTGLHTAPSTDTSDADQHRPTTADPFTGVHPIDTTTGGRPATTPSPAARENVSRPVRRRSRRNAGAGRRTRAAGSRPAGRRDTASPAAPARPAPAPGHRRTGSATRDRRRTGRTAGTSAPNPENRPIGATLFPAGEPALPDAMPTGGERMDLHYVVGVLMGNRELIRRLAAEAGTPLIT